MEEVTQEMIDDLCNLITEGECNVKKETGKSIREEQMGENKISISKRNVDELKRTLNAISKLKKKKQDFKFNNILIHANNKGISIIGGNTDILIKKLIWCDVSNRFKATINLESLREAIESHKSDLYLNFNSEKKNWEMGDGVNLLGDDYNIDFYTGLLNGFRRQEKEVFMHEKASLVRDMLNLSVYNVAPDYARYKQNCILFNHKILEKNSFNNGKCLIGIVATNGKTLSVQELTAEIQTEKDIKLLIPLKIQKIINTIYKGKHAKNKSLLLTIGENFSAFRSDETEIYFRNEVGNFPPYERVIPDFYKWDDICVNKERFMEAIRDIRSIKDKNDPTFSMSFHIDLENEVLTLKACNPMKGEIEKKLGVLYNRGIKIPAVNILLDTQWFYKNKSNHIFNHLETDDMTIFFKDKFSPVIIEDFLSNDRHLIMIIMPLEK